MLVSHFTLTSFEFYGSLVIRRVLDLLAGASMGIDWPSHSLS